MSFQRPDYNSHFLSGGGEMGELIRKKDWAQTDLGPPESWPQSLRATLQIILHSQFPMFLWWGPELLCFYNDAYRKSLGKSGKHPSILGMRAENAWKEIWDTIKPLIDVVLNEGESIFRDDQLIPIFRNGKIEEVYWTFSYSPIHDEWGKVQGVLVTCAETTEKVATRKKLEENQQKLNVTMDASELAVWELDLNTQRATYSERYPVLLGYPKGTVLTHPQILRHLHPDDLPIRNKAFELALSTGVLAYEARIIWNDGSTHWIEGKGKVFFDENGMPVNMIGTVRDITTAKNYQRQLEEREQTFRLLADSMPQHIWTSDERGNVKYFNDSLCEYTGLTEDELFPDPWEKFVHSDDLKENIRAWYNSVREGTDFHFEHRFRNRSGTYRWYLSRAVPQKDSNGNIRLWVGTSTDIQEQKNFANYLETQVNARTTELIALNETLKKSEERYHLMVEEVQDYAILYLSREGIIENWNNGAEKIKGYHASEIIGQNFSVFYTPEDKAVNLPWKLLDTATRTGRAVQEGWRVRKDGTHFWASVVITAVHNANHDVIGFSKFTHDLTEKKEANDLLLKNAAELQRKNEELSKMNKELESFAYISSHDLQEPLRKIQTFASRILDKEYNNLSDYGKDYFQRMQNAAARMQILIDDLLAYSRTNTAERKYEEADLRDVLKDVLSDLQEEINQKGALIEAGELSTVAIIPFQFRQPLHNLISNSLKFIRPDHTPHIRISSKIDLGANLLPGRLTADGIYCHITVTDNGIGFESQYAEKIFGLFQRLHSRTNFEGTGIGLAIVKKIVDNHDGVITATGNIGNGAAFDIYIPAKTSSTISKTTVY